MMRAAHLLTLLPLLTLLACTGKSGIEEDDDEPALNLGGGEDDDDNSNNVAPIAADDAVTTWPWRQTEIAVLSNDTDANGDRLDIAEVSDSKHASVTIYNSVLLLTQTDDYIGEEILTYTADDGEGGTATASLTVTYIEQPILIITAPTDGAVIEGEDVEITFEVTGCDITSPSADAAACHLHKYLDDQTYTDADGTGFGHYDSDGFTISPIDEGEHTFSLWLVANDGSDQAFTPLISDTVSFTVVAAEEKEKDTGGEDTGGEDTGK